MNNQGLDELLVRLQRVRETGRIPNNQIRALENNIRAVRNRQGNQPEPQLEQDLDELLERLQRVRETGRIPNNQIRELENRIRGARNRQRDEDEPEPQPNVRVNNNIIPPVGPQLVGPEGPNNIFNNVIPEPEPEPLPFRRLNRGEIAVPAAPRSFMNRIRTVKNSAVGLARSLHDLTIGQISDLLADQTQSNMTLGQVRRIALGALGAGLAIATIKEFRDGRIISDLTQKLADVQRSSPDTAAAALKLITNMSKKGGRRTMKKDRRRNSK